MLVYVVYQCIPGTPMTPHSVYSSREDAEEQVLTMNKFTTDIKIDIKFRFIGLPLTPPSLEGLFFSNT